MAGWDCRRCSFHHHAPGHRCVMCNELRVGKEQMLDFITGKKTADISNGTTNIHPSQDHGSSTTASAVASGKAGHRPQMTQQILSQAFQQDASKSTTTTGTIALDSRPTTLPSSTITKPVLPTKNPYARPPRTLSQPTSVDHLRAPQSSTSSTLPSNHSNSVNGNAGALDVGSSLHTNATMTSSVQAPPHSAMVNLPTSRPIVHGGDRAKAPNAATNRTLSQTLLAPKKPTAMVAAADDTRKRPRQPTSAVCVPAPLPYQPGPVPLAVEYASTWIFPSDEAYPKRQYQFDMTQSAILQNTLVSLPTGLGKTLIAAVVLYNYYRWFPTGKVLFLAPTVPLVDQQVQACYEIMGIPADDTALLTGKVVAPRRTVLWQSKRVFFCTPQTVQKDLENQRCPAARVVCVVFDEAHKATGDYAYCKVVQYLQEARAKFRILGLSATPGTSIKAIDAVVTTLRINCIEARSDADPDVKLYLHDRQTEVIVVKSAAATKPIERALDNIIGPILDALRKLNALPARLTGNATVTPYSLFQARDFFNRRPEHERDKSALGYFAAGVTMIQIRTDLHMHGIGSVRIKLQQLRNDRPRGYLATIVKSNEFQSLWEMVEEASCDPNASGNDKSKNNPKLAKLVEILTEHFERAKACGTSSRAIVFSQFRNSVAEIVHVLNDFKPLIRARQFVGQGKASAKTAERKDATDEKKDGAQGEGMKQSEQKAVLEQFKGGVHNALVCTSIGEEGLDIGEVDLIVNFDCLSSPIRMIQRVGRTGRKRDGRVVSLVAEGAEERTLAKSRQNERNLFHALRDPRKFHVLPNTPLFPVDPVVVEQNMTIAEGFRMSQVHGAAKGPKAETTVSARNWTLNETEAWKLGNELGPLQAIRIEKQIDGAFPAQIRRRVLAARDRSFLRSTNAQQGRFTVGRTTSLLRRIEAVNPADGVAPTKIDRKARSSPLDILFPVSNCVNAVLDRSEVVFLPQVERELPRAMDKSQEDVLPGRDHQPVVEGSPPAQVECSKALDRLQEVGFPQELDDFRLPSQDDASSSDDNESACGSVCEGSTSNVTSLPLGDAKITAALAAQEASNETTAAESAFDDAFRLPTPDPSSDEEDCTDSECPENAASIPVLQACAALPDTPLPTVESVALDPPHTDATSDSAPKSPSRVRFSFDNNIIIGGGSTVEDTPLAQFPKKNTRRRILAIDDTQDSGSVLSKSATRGMAAGASVDLSNTQDDSFCKDLHCAVCQTDRHSNDDPVILCDGSRQNKQCNLAVHVSCYSLAGVNLDGMMEWRCDPCEFIFRGGQESSIYCPHCRRTDGVLRQTSSDGWRHSTCQPIASRETEPPRRPLERIPQNRRDSTDVVEKKLKRRRAVMERFILDEAEVSDDENDDAEEADVLAMEEEENELASSFINDSSQLGYAADELDQVDPVGSNHADTSHRALDAQRDRLRQFATPLLNRRMQEQHSASDGSWTGDSRLSGPNSTRGLGNMHFIRSVLEHHRNGGRAEEIEAFYNGLEADAPSQGSE